jgi:hypothetical protein
MFIISPAEKAQQMRSDRSSGRADDAVGASYLDSPCTAAKLLPMRRLIKNSRIEAILHRSSPGVPADISHFVREQHLEPAAISRAAGEAG